MHSTESFDKNCHHPWLAATRLPATRSACEDCCVGSQPRLASWLSQCKDRRRKFADDREHVVHAELHAWLSCPGTCNAVDAETSIQSTRPGPSHLRAPVGRLYRRGSTGYGLTCEHGKDKGDARQKFETDQASRGLPAGNFFASVPTIRPCSLGVAEEERLSKTLDERRLKEAAATRVPESLKYENCSSALLWDLRLDPHQLVMNKMLFGLDGKSGSICREAFRHLNFSAWSGQHRR
eukprot:5957441-Amphidinium_carterae.1